MVGHAKARKRRVQTLAEKGQLAALYPWQEVLDSYVFMPDDKCRVFITEQDGKWSMTANIDGKHYSGVRPTLGMHSRHVRICYTNMQKIFGSEWIHAP